MKPGNDMPYGLASSLTVAGPCVKRCTTSRRVASDSAQNTWSSRAGSPRIAIARQVRGSGCSMLRRLPSVSWNATYLPMPGMSMGSPNTSPPA